MILSNQSTGRSAVGKLFAAAGFLVMGMASVAPPAPAQERAPAVPLAETADAARIEKAVKAAAGKVVLVNFWAAWNEPSRAQYPGFVYLYDRYHAQGLEVISVSADPVQERDAHVIPFIAAQKTKFPTFIKSDGDTDAFMKAVDTAWTGTLPRTYLLGRNGRVRQVVSTRINPDRFESYIQRLLKEEPPKPTRNSKGVQAGDPAPARHPRGFLGGG